MKSKLSAAFVAASVVVSAASAQADPVLSIGLQSPGGPIVMYPGPEGVSPDSTFTHVRISALPNPGEVAPTPNVPLLQGVSIEVAFTPGTLVVWITGSGNLGANLPSGTQRFESSFRQNLLPDGWTVQVDSFLDPSNGIFTTTIPLSSHLFHASDPTFDQIVRADPGSGFYSVTERFTISANGVVGSTNTSADIAFVAPASVPAPIAGAGLPGMITVLGGVGLLGWWRRRRGQGADGHAQAAPDAA